MSSLSWDDPLLAKFNLTDQTITEALIASADAAVDRYCNRNLAQATYDKVLKPVGGSIHLPAYPVANIFRVCLDQEAALTVYPDDPLNVVSTGVAVLTLKAITAGTYTATVLAYSDYPTIQDLADEINATDGFSAAVASIWMDSPSSDLVAGQCPQTEERQLKAWINATDDFQSDPDTGLLCVGHCTKVRVVWQGGFDPYPEDLKAVIAELVGKKASSIQGTVTAESFGQNEYSYSLGPVDLAALPVTHRAILSSYKIRGL